MQVCGVEQIYLKYLSNYKPVSYTTTLLGSGGLHHKGTSYSDLTSGCEYCADVWYQGLLGKKNECALDRIAG